MMTNKFNIGNVVFYMCENKVCNGKIKSIYLRDSDAKNIYIEYSTHSGSFREDMVFKTKSELIKSL